MLKEIIEQIVRDFLNEKMAHTLLPQAVYAKVTKGGRHQVNLRILDKDGQIDKRYEEIPNIKTEVSYEKGNQVVLSFIHGELEQPVILRKEDHLPQVRFAKVTKGGTSLINLQLLDKDVKKDKLYEELRNVANDFPLVAGDQVIVSFLHNEFKKPIVIRKWEG